MGQTLQKRNLLLLMDGMIHEDECGRTLLIRDQVANAIRAHLDHQSPACEEDLHNMIRTIRVYSVADALPVRGVFRSSYDVILEKEDSD